MPCATLPWKELRLKRRFQCRRRPSDSKASLRSDCGFLVFPDNADPVQPIIVINVLSTMTEAVISKNVDMQMPNAFCGRTPTDDTNFAIPSLALGGKFNKTLDSEVSR